MGLGGHAALSAPEPERYLILHIQDFLFILWA